MLSIFDRPLPDVMAIHHHHDVPQRQSMVRLPRLATGEPDIGRGPDRLWINSWSRRNGSVVGSIGAVRQARRPRAIDLNLVAAPRSPAAPPP
jgi:hypothetical protein